jgi:outer membrane protein assembly factor BamB
MRIANAAAAVIAGCVILLGASGAGAQDWPQWRGTNRDGKVTGFTAPKTWPKELTKKWSVSVGDGVATPALVGDKLYVFGRQGGDEVVRCLNASDGKDVWTEKYASAGFAGPDGGFVGPRSSPVVTDGKVVTLGSMGILTCFDAASGKQLWQKDDFKGSQPRFHVSSSPIVVDGLCIAQLGGGSRGGIVAYDLASGTEKWKWTGDGPGYASPTLLTLSGTKVIVAETDGNIVAVNAADGKELWKTAFKVRYNACTPMVDGQTVIYSGAGSGTKAVKIEKKGDEASVSNVWTNSDNAVMFNTPVIKNGLLFGISDSNKVFCINAETGKTAWSTALGTGGGGGGGGGKPGRGGMGGGGYGSIVDAGTVLFALTPAGQLTVFEPSDKEFKKVAEYKVASGNTYAYPVVSGNRVFIKDKDSLTLYTLE